MPFADEAGLEGSRLRRATPKARTLNAERSTLNVHWFKSL
jgi:hypothetical protein